MGCDILEKPKKIPYYYISHNITPDPNNDWVCVTGQWVWTVRGKEEEQVKTEEKRADSMAYTAPTRDMYGSILYNGKRYMVWTDSKYGDYIIVNHQNLILNPGWWETRGRRERGETQTRGTFEYPSKLKEGGYWKPSLPSLDMPNLSMPAIDVKMPSLPSFGKEVKLIGGFVVLLVVGVVLLVAIGYSGMGESVGRIGEGEYKRKVR